MQIKLFNLAALLDFPNVIRPNESNPDDLIPQDQIQPKTHRGGPDSPSDGESSCLFVTDTS